MNFIHNLLQGAQLLKFNFSMKPGVSTLPFITQDVKQEEGVTPPNDKETPSGDIYKFQALTQQEIIKRQLIENLILQTQQQQLYKILEQAKQQQSPEEKQQPEASNNPLLCKKKISKKSNSCGHPEKEHYAKGMCSNCYHRFGRNKKPWRCCHDKLYAQGLCQNCYINQYNQVLTNSKLSKKRKETKSEDIQLSQS